MCSKDMPERPDRFNRKEFRFLDNASLTATLPIKKGMNNSGDDGGV